MKVSKPHTISRRKSIDTAADPYLMTVTINGMAVCKKCHSVFSNKRWSIDEDLYREKADQKGTSKVLCPACRKVKDNFPGGIVTLRGEFLAEHKDEILNLIRNEEDRARGFNPLERIMAIKEQDEEMEITTTNEKLAQRIGKSLQRAYQGRVHYKWSHDTKLLRAEWSR
ncbi:MAG: hypothetical protein JSU90_04575 [Nitrospiraceae bacterium]|nr:MAG: hypothetical protein JSU90_04575 [Nitrospiraceae bacterium]